MNSEKDNNIQALKRTEGNERVLWNKITLVNFVIRIKR